MSFAPQVRRLSLTGAKRTPPAWVLLSENLSVDSRRQKRFIPFQIPKFYQLSRGDSHEKVGFLRAFAWAGVQCPIWLCRRCVEPYVIWIEFQAQHQPTKEESQTPIGTVMAWPHWNTPDGWLGGFPGAVRYMVRDAAQRVKKHAGLHYVACPAEWPAGSECHRQGSF